jgi:hypothetical protein
MMWLYHRKEDVDSGEIDRLWLIQIALSSPDGVVYSV